MGLQGVTPSASSTRQAQVPEVLEGSLVGWKQWLQMAGVSFPRITNTGCSAPTGAPHLGQGMALEEAEIRAGGVSQHLGTGLRVALAVLGEHWP